VRGQLFGGVVEFLFDQRQHFGACGVHGKPFEVGSGQAVGGEQ
jgi:hypothetical protein